MPFQCKTSRTTIKFCLSRGFYDFLAPRDKKLRKISHGGQRENQVHASARKAAKENGKFIGLHFNSVTCWLEDIDSFNHLKEFKGNPAYIKDKPYFIGNSEEQHLDKLAILDAYEFYCEVQKIQEDHRIKEVGKIDSLFSSYAQYGLKMIIKRKLFEVIFKQQEV